jgi:signal transduction histidine kinase
VRPRSLLLFTVAAAVWPLVAWLHRERLPAGVVTVERAAFLPQATAAPPEDTAGWTDRALPDDWGLPAPGERGTSVREGWYRLALEAHTTGEADWALYLPSVRMNAAVYLNGRLVGDGGRLTDPVARNWNRPLLFRLPRWQLRRDENVLHIRLAADRPGRGFLGPVHVAPAAVLEPVHARRYALKVTSLWAITIFAAMMAIFTAALWAQRRAESYYGWYAFTALAWALINLYLLITEVPVPDASRDGFLYVSLGWFVIAAARALQDFSGVGEPRVNRLLLVYGIAGSVVLATLAALDSPWFHVVGGFGWMTSGFVVAGYALHQVGSTARARRGGSELSVVYLSGIPVLSCGLHDVLVWNGLLGPANGYYLPYSAPVTLGGMGWVLLHRFVGALRRSESLVADLEARVEQKRVELELRHGQIRELERTRVLSEERERIMRDIHDGLGSRLVSTLALIEHADAAPEEVSTALREVLDELRLFVHSLEPVEGDLLAALATLRAWMQPRLEARGLRVEWQVGQVAIPDFGPRNTVNVLRILQEAFSNVLKHARASVVRVRVAPGERDGVPGIVVELADDGRGATERGLRGRGTDNMRHRAAEIGVDLELRSSPGDTVVRLWIPGLA